MCKLEWLDAVLARARLRGRAVVAVGHSPVFSAGVPGRGHGKVLDKNRQTRNLDEFIFDCTFCFSVLLIFFHVNPKISSSFYMGVSSYSSLKLFVIS